MGSTQTVPDIPYGAHPAQRLDIHVPTGAAGRPLLCFVHGGAWRSEDKAEHAQLAQRLAVRTGCAVACPNYRLTPSEPTQETALLHPAHAEDVLAALVFLISWEDPPAKYDPKSLYFVGHSCGAHILTSIFLDSSAATPSLAPPAPLLAATKGIALSEGIYDLDLLITRFPEYKAWFVANAFGDRASYAEFSTARYPLRAHGAHVRWLIIHSGGDTLIDLAQSKAIYEHLISLETEDSRFSTVRNDWETLTSEHNAMLKTTQYTDLVGDFFRSLQRQ